MPEQRGRPLTRQALQFALGIGLVYMLAGVAWILTSDALVDAFSADPAWRAVLQRGKGLFYVLATGAGLVLLVRWGTMRLLKAIALARDNELQVQDLFFTNPVPMWIYAPDTLAVLQVNQAAVATYGHSVSEFLAMKVSELDGPNGPAQGRERGERRLATKSGEPVFALISEHRVPFDGRIAVLVMAIDVTRDVLARHALARQEDQYRQLHQSLGEVLWIASVDGGQVLYLSPAFETLYGRPRAEFLADTALWLSVVHEDDLAVAAASRTVLAERGSCACEYRIRRPDGSLRWISDRKKTIVDGDGLVTLIAGIAEDITASKELEIARATTHAELERRVVERTVELERVNAELDAFTRTAAHDLKTPLNGIVGFNDILQMRHGAALGSDGLRLSRRIGESARQMAGLVNDLMTLSLATTKALERSEVDLVPLARELIDELRHQEPQREVEFTAPARLWVWCDRGLARSLMANLIGNAWKFTGPCQPGRIRLAADAADADGTVVRVEDNGAGFDATHAHRLFEPFQRFHAAGQFAGTGVGLATCRRIVQRHDGEIRVESTPGQGTVVSFRLPAPAAAVPAPVSPARIDAVPA